jgi:hypothetical protein
LFDRQHCRQLDERQWVAAGRGDDVVGDELVDPYPRPCCQQLVGLSRGEPFQRDAAEAFEAPRCVRRVAHGEQRGDPFAVEAAAHERQRHC